MFPIASANPTGSTQVTFSSIPQQFSHLQVRIFARSAQAITNTNTRMRINGDTGANYVIHQLQGNGSSASSSANLSLTELIPFLGTTPAASLTSGIFGNGIIDILDYTNTNKNKVTRTISGYDGNGSGIASLSSGLWLSTSAITSLTVFIDGDWVSGSRVDLYGISTSSATGA
jgi:hypothetical protein